jgi:hypothetical protein
MFDVFCDGCRKHQLLTAGRVRGMGNDASGITLAYECWCGATGAEQLRRPVETAAAA